MVWYISLWYKAFYLSVLDHGRTVVQSAVMLNRHTYDNRHVFLEGELCKFSYLFLTSSQKKTLAEKVSAAVSADAKFREYYH